ncbi:MULTISPECIES: helix-turn-helix domain-containing protein [unclassified Neptuniibacter]|uniref:helix-turn-helix domain-containing protein n=1 Tax=unclassified Neptuniibacter TaxID=2630693 RepID=UPI000C4D01FE|nr:MULTISPECIES: helix-turn-helix domain-containing protein [unclassified Neptuniibacter]MAY41903.1 hypothetical protein [Oceanospirillaceae bacterium]|tara:strand:+ start:2584 stop:2907 length:324 start_codon:yes stop_codon:yes gene_type:complete
MPLFRIRTSLLSYEPAKHYTQTELVLAVLQIKGPTTTDQFHSLEVKSPSAVIYRLRKLGYSIRTKYIQRNSLENPYWVMQAEYTLFYESAISRSLPLFFKGSQENSQ